MAQISLEEYVRRYWRTCRPIDMARFRNVEESVVRQIAEKLGLTKPPVPKVPKPEPVDPDPETIARLATDIRAGWSDEEYYKRAVGVNRRKRWTAPMINLDIAFSNRRKET